MEPTIQELPEEEALQEWRQRQSSSASRSRFNSIHLDNKSVIWVTEKDEVTGLMAEKKTINPNYGKLVATWHDDSGEHSEEIDIKKAQFYLAKSRQSVTFKDINQAKSYIIPEAEPFRNIHIIDKETKEEVATGKYKDLKEEWDLKYSEAVYVYYDEKIFRWKITSAHFESWFDIRRQLQNASEPTMFKVKSIVDQTDSKVDYNVMTFELGEPIPVSIAVSVDRMVDEFFAAKEKQFTEEEVNQLEEAVDDKPF